jgi:AcrR family transcriptional regulator
MKSKRRAPTLTRAYRQVGRAKGAEATGRRILEAFENCFHSRWFDEVTLAEVAKIAGVTMRTVIRRYGTKSGLLAALIHQMVPDVRTRRTPAPGNRGDLVDRTLAVYEQIGDGVIRNLSQESRIPELQPLIDIGRREQRRITAETFAEALKPLDAPQARRTLDLLVISTDVYTWKLLRRDMRRSVKDTRESMLDLVQAALARAGDKPSANRERS